MLILFALISCTFVSTTYGSPQAEAAAEESSSATQATRLSPDVFCCNRHSCVALCMKTQYEQSTPQQGQDVPKPKDPEAS